MTHVFSAAFRRVGSTQQSTPVGDLVDPVLVTQGCCDEYVDAETNGTSKNNYSTDLEYELVSSCDSYSVRTDGDDDSDTDLDFDTEGAAIG